MRKVQHTPEDASLYRRIAAGDTKLRNMMAERHLGLVQSLATYYAKRNPHLDMEDLIQEGRIGVIVALGKFNVDKGFRFSTYAMYWIKHHIQKYVISNHSGGASAAKKDTEAYMSRDADGMPCTEAMGTRDRALYESRCVMHASLSSRAGEDVSYEEIVEDRDAVPVDEDAESRLEWQIVERTIQHETIDPVQRSVVCMRFGVMGYRQHTIPEVARKLGIPALRVTAIEQTTVMHISRLMEDTDGDDGDQALDSGQARG